MFRQISRREMLKRSSQVVVAGTSFACLASTKQKKNLQHPFGLITGEEVGVGVGQKVLNEGGNAIDAAVAAALASCVATPSRCGIGGYGGHLTLALGKSRKITCIDFNTAAPSAARSDMYPLDGKGAVEGAVNFYGWRAVGVPGTLAGLQLALERYGTRSFSELVQPAISLANNGLVVNSALARALRNAAPRFVSDPGSAKLYLRGGKLLSEGDRLYNPELGRLLSTLAQRNSVDSFYRGDLAQRLAEEFEKNGGLVTARDLAAYQAREVQPLRLKYDSFEVCTAPLTAGGLTVLEALSIFRAVPTAKTPSASIHARLEALRFGWKDRLELLGDPQKTEVPVTRLLSNQHTHELARQVKIALDTKTPVAIKVEKHLQDGTNNFSAVDRHGNMVALTLTHGGSFGAQVTADGLGLTLGHGMSRFNPRPGHANAPGPGKRPLNNMCPTIILHRGHPVLALGGAGGVKIPNAIFEVLVNYLVRGAGLEEAISAPRLQCTGTMEVTVEPHAARAEAEYLREVGFHVQTGPSALVSGVSLNPETGECRKAMR